MTARLSRHFAKRLLCVADTGVQIRHGHVLRGLPPHKARSLQQRLKEIEDKNPTKLLKVDIGLPTTHNRVKSAWLSEYQKNRHSKEAEKSARNRTLVVDLPKVNDIWLETDGPFHSKAIAEHYGIFRDLFNHAYFHPVVPLDISYPNSNETVVKVYRGNVVKPCEAEKQPTVVYSSKESEDTLWTLIMTTPDGNMTNPNNEYCHWFVGNIRGNMVQEGQEIIDYLKPFPPRGIGYFRYVFVLYKQEKPLDFAEYKREEPCRNLIERNWNTLEFYRKYQDDLTPAGLAFFQADWDPSVKEFYHSVLGTREPICQYDFPKPHLRKQEWFPIRRAFNTYLDRYKDPRDVMKRYLLEKLVDVHPFRKPEPPLQFPHAQPYQDEDEPSWLRVEKKKNRLGWGRINDL